MQIPDGAKPAEGGVSKRFSASEIDTEFYDQ